MHTVNWYADWVHGQVDVDPSVQTRQWSSEWKRLHDALSPPEVNGIFEFASIVVARWEFLGGLYLGKGTTKAVDAREYMREFLVPENPLYAGVENLVTNPAPDRLDFFTMLRNKPLHGLHPTAIAGPDAKQVVTWWIGFTGIQPGQHLMVSADGELHIDCNLLFAELQGSMERYAQYLYEDTHLINAVNPTTRWRRGYWERFAPKFMPGPDWTQLGRDRGVKI